jgi:ferredoxin
MDLQSHECFVPVPAAERGKRVAIIGAGPAGLAAAYYLRRAGYACTVFDDHDEPGGMLRYGVAEAELPREVLTAEIETIEQLGVGFCFRTRVGTDVPMSDVRTQFDAVFIGTGEWRQGDAEGLSVAAGPEGVEIDRRSYATKVRGVFAGGDAVRKRRLAVRAVADGKEAAFSIARYLSGEPATGPARAFNSRMGKLAEGEMETFLQSASLASRRRPSGPTGGFVEAEARVESSRCLHCDCRKPNACLLRRYAQVYDARQTRYKAERRTFVQQTQHPDVIYEPGKCIDCGICIQIASASKENLGLTFIGRGFDVRVAVPFEASLAEGLQVAAKICVEACPTGALAFKNDVAPSNTSDSSSTG